MILPVFFYYLAYNVAYVLPMSLILIIQMFLFIKRKVYIFKIKYLDFQVLKKEKITLGVYLVFVFTSEHLKTRKDTKYKSTLNAVI